jgi:hypothetical protein
VRLLTHEVGLYRLRFHGVSLTYQHYRASGRDEAL